MVAVTRYPQNPILIPDKHANWESFAVLNGSVVKKDNEWHMLYRAISAPQQWQDEYMFVSTIGHAVGPDGKNFSKRRQLLIPEYEWERYGCEDPRVTYIDGKYYIFYTALSTNPPSPQGIRVGVAISSDLASIEEKHLVTPFNAKAMVLFPEKINGKYAALVTVDTDNPPSKIALVLVESLSDLWERSFWELWHGNIARHTIALLRRSQDHVEIGLNPIKTPEGWLIVYSYIQNYFTPRKVFGIESALLDFENPLHVRGQTNGPFMIPEAYPEWYGTVPNIIFPSGGVVEEDTLHLYYGASDTCVCTADISISALVHDILTQIPELPIESKHSALHLTRFEGNPILKLVEDHPWESFGVLNAAVLKEEKNIAILYRALDSNFRSTIGMAITTDGLHVDQRFPSPIYIPRAPFEINASGGADGCEDPRITQMGETLYMHYTGYNGVVPRVVHTSISLSDFQARQWNWAEPQVISNPSVMDKNSAVFPEKINGKFAILHRLDVRIWLDFVTDFSEFGEGEGKRWLDGDVLMSPRPNKWDSVKVGIAGPPIKTKLGWLLIYHGISQLDQKYRLGIAMLDAQDPRKILLRLDEPILEPKLYFENMGIRPGAVFSCGSAVQDDTLFVYYGASDSTLCVARISYSYLLEHLEKMLLAST